MTLKIMPVAIQDRTVDLRLLSLSFQVRHLKQQVAKLTEKSRCDALTGLYNRAYLQQWIIDHQVTSKQMIVVYVDIDQFKHVNDHYGHDIGDVLLRRVADSLKNCCRKKDCAIRIGGDEFILILPNIEQSKVSAVKKKIVRKLQLASQIGFSFGIAAGLMSEVKKLITISDRMMYQHKLDKAAVIKNQMHSQNISLQR